MEAPQVNSASPEATSRAVAASADGGFEQRYQAKYGHPSLTSEASLGQIPANKHLSKHQLNTLIATAETPADHQRIAQFYQSQAQDYLAQSKENAREAEQSRSNPMRNNNKAVFSTVNHCEYYAQKFSDLAFKSQVLAQRHEQMAAGVGTSSGLRDSAHFPTSESLGGRTECVTCATGDNMGNVSVGAAKCGHAESQCAEPSSRANERGTSQGYGGPQQIVDQDKNQGPGGDEKGI